MAKSVEIQSNFKVKARQINAYAALLSKQYLADATAVALDEVGFTAVKDFMRATTIPQAIKYPPKSPTDVLTVRTGRLAGSIVGNFRFSSTRLPRSVEKFKSGEYKSSKAEFGGGKNESIREIKITTGGIQGIIGSRVPYAARHEFGKSPVPARPYLRPAVKVAFPAIHKIYLETITSTFKREKI